MTSGTALLFGGQGSQTPGMGKALRQSSSAAREVFAEAAHAADFPLLEIMESGPTGELTRTEVAQPALLTVTVAEGRELLAQGLTPRFLAGHSLGQYAALVIAGALPFAAAIKLVIQRGRLMQKAVPEGEGRMAAVIGADRETIQAACASSRDQGVVDVACHNTRGQTVISGTVAAVESAAEKLESEGAAILPLEVSVPFHCALLAPIQEEFRTCLAGVALQAPRIPVIDNVSARPLTDARSVGDSLVEQITAPVLFEESLHYLAEQGVNRLIQCGPGKQLLTFARRMVKGARLETFDVAAGLGEDDRCQEAPGT